MSPTSPEDRFITDRPEDRLADRIILALDLPSAAEALALLDTLDPRLRWVKVGMELFYAEGPPLVHELRARGYQVFLDLKLHDIPHTVAAAVRSATRTGASLLTVHAAGGPAMLAAAAEAAATTPGSPRLLAVTVLTSMDRVQLFATGVPGSPAEQVLRLAHLAWTNGIRGLVCSAHEVALLRAELGPEAELVVPGIRPSGSDAGDQRRTATPTEALQRGASRLVIGRPVTHAPDPAAALEAILDEIAQAERSRPTRTGMSESS